MTSSNLPVLTLRRNEERRLAAGHLWVYSNEVDTRKTPLSGFEPGSLAVIQSSVGKTLGSGFVNPHSLICARLLTRRPRTQIDAAFFERRLRSALQLRESLFDQPCYRLVYGESDGLPGLVIDRYGDVLVVQITTAGMEAVRDVLLGVIDRLLSPAWCWRLAARQEERRHWLELALSPDKQRLYVAESGINAVAVINAKTQNAPGEVYTYNDKNTDLLAMLAEGVTGQRSGETATVAVGGVLRLQFNGALAGRKNLGEGSAGGSGEPVAAPAPGWRVLAGGTDLLTQYEHRLKQLNLLDLSALAELMPVRYAKQEEGENFVAVLR